MIRIREIMDLELRRRVVEALARLRGCSTGGIPDWFELDDADFVDLLNLIQDQETEHTDERDWRQ